jgi:hypothetical protein
MLRKCSVLTDFINYLSVDTKLTPKTEFGQPIKYRLTECLVSDQELELVDIFQCDRCTSCYSS